MPIGQTSNRFTPLHVQVDMACLPQQVSTTVERYARLRDKEYVAGGRQVNQLRQDRRSAERADADARRQAMLDETELPAPTVDAIDAKINEQAQRVQAAQDAMLSMEPEIAKATQQHAQDWLADLDHAEAETDEHVRAVLDEAAAIIRTKAVIRATRQFVLDGGRRGYNPPMMNGATPAERAINTWAELMLPATTTNSEETTKQAATEPASVGAGG